MSVLTALGATAAAYLVGSIPVGYLLGRAWGVNVLTSGSGRTGGTNLYRTLGLVPALLTGALDIAKGLLAVWLAGVLVGDPLAQVLAGAAAVLGHIHSAFLGFRGGAGVGTSLGALAAIHLPAAIGLVVVLLVVIAVTRFASIGSLTISALMPLVLLGLALSHILPLVYVVYGLLALLLIVYAHRPNIRRLLDGTERRVGRPPPLRS